MNTVFAVFRRGKSAAARARLGGLLLCLLTWAATAHAQVSTSTLSPNLAQGTITSQVCNAGNEPVTVTLVTYYVSEPSSVLVPNTDPTSITRTVSSQAVYDFKTVTIPAATPAGKSCVMLTVRIPTRCPIYEADIYLGPLKPILLGTDQVLQGSLFIKDKEVFEISAAQLRECNPTICTVTQGGYGAPPQGNNPAAFLKANFPPGGVYVGGRYLLTFNSAEAVRAFLPSGGTPGVLNKSLLNPTKATGTSAGVFASQVLALRLNVSFNPAFGALRLCSTGTSLDGITVAQILVLANRVLGGDLSALPAGYSVSGLNDLVDKLNNSFVNCQPNGFAQKNLCQ